MPLIDKYRQKLISQALYDKNPDRNESNLISKKTDDSLNVYEIGTQLDIAMRDGMNPNELSPVEREIYIDIFGINKLNVYKNVN